MKSTYASLPAYDAGAELGFIDRSHLGEPEFALLNDAIHYLDSTEESTWWAGPTYRSPCGTQHCALSHVAKHWDMETMEIFESIWATSYTLGAANDGTHRDYPQPTAKTRSLAFLADLQSGLRCDVNTSMERDSRASILYDATRVTLDVHKALSRATQLGHPTAVTAPLLEAAIGHWSAAEPARALAATRSAGISDDHAFQILYSALREARNAAA
ncbi:hypothetical protein LG293_16960 (plasmid) [Citricoccus nitrophenolicus]